MSVDFNWKGYRCDSFNFHPNHKVVHGVHPRFRLLNQLCAASSKKQADELTQFINNCSQVDELEMHRHHLLDGLSEVILSQLTALTLQYRKCCIPFNSGFEKINQYCRQLKTFHASGYKTHTYDDAIQIINEIVANNPNLHDIYIRTNEDIFNILINGNYTKLQKVSLEFNDVKMSEIFKLIEQYSLLYVCINSNNISLFKYKAHYEIEVEWIVSLLNDELLSDVIEFAAATTISIRTDVSSVCDSLFQAAVKKFEKLQLLHIVSLKSDCNWIEIIKLLPSSLHTLKVGGLTASIIVTIFQQIRTLIKSEFEDVIDDSVGDVMHQLRTILTEYPKLSEQTLIWIDFVDKRFLQFRNGNLTFGILSG